MLFSQRQGIKPVKSVIQVDGMDDDLRNSLWNVLTVLYWESAFKEQYFPPEIRSLLDDLWINFFKRPIDALPKNWGATHKIIRDSFFTWQWNEVYDFVEFVANNCEDTDKNKQFMDICNSILVREVSAYRFVGGEIAPFTNEEEISEIEQALSLASSSDPITIHLKKALDLFADRQSPDYSNSIKESISAVEALCQKITGDSKATLGKALASIQIKGLVEFHPALRASLEKLYAYTSDAEGIRHALSDKPGLDSEDAKFMLVSCSAFINYLVAKAVKAGTKL